MHELLWQNVIILTIVILVSIHCVGDFIVMKWALCACHWWRFPFPCFKRNFHYRTSHVIHIFSPCTIVIFIVLSVPSFIFIVLLITDVTCMVLRLVNVIVIVHLSSAALCCPCGKVLFYCQTWGHHCYICHCFPHCALINVIVSVNSVMWMYSLWLCVMWYSLQCERFLSVSILVIF